MKAYLYIARSTSLTINQQIKMKEEICLSRKAVLIEQKFNIAGNVYLNKLNDPLCCLFTFPKMCCSLKFDLETGHKFEGGGEGRVGRLVQIWGGPLFFMQAQKGGSKYLVHVIKGVIIFYAKLLRSRSQPRILL